MSLSSHKNNIPKFISTEVYKHLLPEISTPEIYEMFVYKHAETVMFKSYIMLS